MKINLNWSRYKSLSIMRRYWHVGILLLPDAAASNRGSLVATRVEKGGSLTALVAFPVHYGQKFGFIVSLFLCYFLCSLSQSQ